MKNYRLILLLLLLIIPASLLSIASISAFTRAVSAAANNLPVPFKTAASPYDWLEFGFDARHSGNDTLEATVTKANVNALSLLFQVRLPGVADGAPVYLSSVSTPSGIKNLAFLTTRDGYIVAVSAADGSLVWTKKQGPGTCKINNGVKPCYTTSSPAIDPNRQYVYSYGLDGKVHKYRVGTGTEVVKGGWPEVTTDKAFDEKGSPALSIATDRAGKSFLYAANGGYPGDYGDYQGHITAINLADGSQRVFNSMCSNQEVHFVEKPGIPDCAGVQSAIWARPGVIFDAETNKLYMATGNGAFNPSKHYWGDTVFSLNPNGTGSNGNPLDSYTPSDFLQLSNSDLDLGSTAPAILPAPAASSVQHLAVQAGKDSILRLINLDDMSGKGGPGHVGGEIGTNISLPQGGEVLTQPAVWVNPDDGSTWVFVANNSGISGLELTLDQNNLPKLLPIWQRQNIGTSPILANGVMFFVGPRNVWALDPTTGATLWNDTQIGDVHWESPIEANGVLYITDENDDLTAYTLPGLTGTATPSPIPSITLTPTLTPTPRNLFLPFILKGN